MSSEPKGTRPTAPPDLPLTPGDPPISAAATAAHLAAERAGESTYIDPPTGYMVMTATHLWAQGQCCGRACRHCPFPGPEQARAGRARVRS